MDKEDFGKWDFKPELENGNEILCPECKKWSGMNTWREGEVGCEDCGSHPAIVCPLCETCFDWLKSEVFSTRAGNPDAN